MHKNLEQESVSAVESPRRPNVDELIAKSRNETGNRINSLVLTSAPDATKDKPKEGEKKPEEKKPEEKKPEEKKPEEKKPEEKKPEEKKPEEKKPEEKKPEEKKPEPKAEEKPAPSNVRSNNAEPVHSTHEPKNFARNATIGVTATAATMAAVSPSILAELPLIGKIPYLPQAAAALQAGINSMIAPLGLGTGANATNWVMASIPYTGVGTALGAGVLIPAGLWSIGMIKSLITGERYGGLLGNIKEAGRTIVGLPFKTYRKIIGARNWAGEKAGSAWNIATTPFKGAWNVAKHIGTGTWNGAKEATSAALTPTKAGGVGLALGTIAGTMAAPLTGGASLLTMPLLGFAGGNMLKNTGSLNGSSSAAAAHAGH